tara:strand:- start:536 stop:1060 length:525 start_codon:yes stop_codon:yes gene_type:complete
MHKYSEDVVDWFARFPYQTTYDSGLSVRELFPSAFENDEFVGSFSIDTTVAYINVNALGDFEPDSSTISDKDREAMINKAREAREDRIWERKRREAERKRKEWEASPEGKWALLREKQYLQRKLDECNKRFEKIEAKRLKEKKKRDERKAFEARVKREVRRALKQRELELEQKE